MPPRTRLNFEHPATRRKRLWPCAADPFAWRPSRTGRRHGHGPEGTARLMKEAELYLTRAARMGADLVAFTEIYPQLALADPYHHAEPSDGGTLDHVRELARKHKMIVVWPRLEYDPVRQIRNTSILVGRDGEVIGRYDKMFPTIPEMEKGVIPGTLAPVFETDLGKVGL